MPLPARLQRLIDLAAREPRRILGLMSGTSLDGLDLALCDVRGHGAATAVNLRHARTVPYEAAARARLAAAASHPAATARDLCELNAWLAEWHARAVLGALADWGLKAVDVDCLASHGQTVHHAPDGSDETGATLAATLQLGDGDRLAVRTGILTVSDFRQKEIASGGQGAPLAPYAEALLCAHPTAPRILLNLGGIANFTWLPPGGGTFAAGDTGPGNTLIDRAVRDHTPAAQEEFDRDGALAATGEVDTELLGRLKAHPYFGVPFPKSTGPEVFGADFLAGALAGRPPLRGASLAATLTRLTAETVAEALRREVPAWAGAAVYVSGGGRHNATLMGWLAALLPELSWRASDELGLPTDHKEAVLFAVLANETLCGTGFLPPGASRPLGFGKLSFPD